MNPNAWTEREICIYGGSLFTIFVALALAIFAGPISREAASRSSDILMLEGHDWASVERYGRGMAILGDAPSEEAGEAARAAVEVDWSVRDAWAEYSVAPPKPAPAPAPEPTAEKLAASGPPVEDIGECQALLDALLAEQVIHFDLGAATLTSESHGLLRDIGGALLRCEAVVATVAGHTDATGDAEANMALSLARAEAVVDHLTALGVPADQLAAEGFGEEQPIADNDTPEGQAMNRRIEFKVAGKGDSQ